MRAAPSGVVRLGLFAGLLLTFAALTAVGLRSVENSPRPTHDDAIELRVPYEASFVAAWVRGCRASGESSAFCHCAIDEYTTRLRPDEFDTAAVVAYSGGDISELPDNVRIAIEDVERECR